MPLEIRILHLCDVELESSFLVLAHDMGIATRVPVLAHLILGGDEPILVDTGVRDTEILGRLGMRTFQTEEQLLENQLALHGVALEDVGAVVHTHLHIDHAGGDDRFPLTTPVIVNRRELEFSVSGLMGAQYPPEYVKHLVDRLHTPGALRLLDLELTGPVELFPGVVAEAAQSHTEGSAFILVETAGGTACICGDVLYDVQNQVVEPWHQANALEPAPSGNHATTKRQEKAAIKRALQHAFVLPMHDWPAKVEHGRVVARLHDRVPGGRDVDATAPLDKVAPSMTG